MEAVVQTRDREKLWWRYLISDILQVVQSVCPANGQVIAKVRTGNNSDYNRCVEAAQQAWHSWVDLPAPRRGEIVRQIGDALRSKLEPLGKLVSLEMGKLQVCVYLSLWLIAVALLHTVACLMLQWAESLVVDTCGTYHTQALQCLESQEKKAICTSACHPEFIMVIPYRRL